MTYRITIEKECIEYSGSYNSTTTFKEVYQQLVCDINLPSLIVIINETQKP